MKYLRYFEYNIDRFKQSNIENIIRQYLLTALWTADDESDRNSFQDKSVYDFSNEAKKQAKEEIEWFIDITGDAIIRSNISDGSIGHYLWLTRNGHGSGFWDNNYRKEDEDELCYLSEILGECLIYTGDDGKIYFDGSKKYKEFDIQKYKEELKLKRDINKYNL
jgi:hypothetical protein